MSRIARRRAQKAAVLARSADMEKLVGRRSLLRLDVDKPPKTFHAKPTELQIVCQRLRKLPLHQLAPSLPEVHAQIRQMGSTKAVAQFWSSVSRRVLVNCGDIPLVSLSFALSELQRLELLSKVSRVGKVVRGLARQAMSLRSADLLPFLRCCEILQRQLVISKPQAANCWAGRLYRVLSRSLPPTLVKAPPALVIQWLKIYAEHGLFDHEHVELWDAAGESLKEAVLSCEDEASILNLQDQVPLWIVECLPEIAKFDTLQKVMDAAPPFTALPVQGHVTGVVGLASGPRSFAPMYQKAPPVPVLWHNSPETYERGLSRLGAKQLVLALRYVAADGAGTSKLDGFAAQKSESLWPRRHRSRSRAQQFVAALLTHLASRSPTKSSHACSAVKSLASLKKQNLLAAEASETAAEALQALVSGPLSGYTVAMELTPSDVSLLLQGMAGLVAQEPRHPIEKVAAAALHGGGAVSLIKLTACAIQEAGVPPRAARAICSAATTLAQGQATRPMHQALHGLLKAAAVAVRDGPSARLREPLAVLRAAGDCQLWSSEAFSTLAHMVTELILGRPGRARWPGDWKPLLPRSGYVRSKWRMVEVAEVAWLFAQHTKRRPLEGQTAVALSFTLLVQLPLLKTSLISGADRSSVDRRLLEFACDSCCILRSSLEVPFFEQWGRPQTYPGNHRSTPEEFDPQLLPDSAMAKQCLLRWKRMIQSPTTGECRARRGSRTLQHISAGLSEHSERHVFEALLALAVFGIYNGSLLAAPAMSCLLRAYVRHCRVVGWDLNRLRLRLRHLSVLKQENQSEKTKRRTLQSRSFLGICVFTSG